MALQHAGFFRYDSDIVAKAIFRDNRASQFSMVNKGAIYKQANPEVAYHESNNQVSIFQQIIDKVTTLPTLGFFSTCFGTQQPRQLVVDNHFKLHYAELGIKNQDQDSMAR
jgi:hypothetical protein